MTRWFEISQVDQERRDAASAREQALEAEAQKLFDRISAEQSAIAKAIAEARNELMDIESIRPGASADDLKKAVGAINEALNQRTDGGEPVTSRPTLPENFSKMADGPARDKALADFGRAEESYSAFLLGKKSLSPDESAWLASQVVAWERNGRS